MRKQEMQGRDCHRQDKWEGTVLEVQKEDIDMNFGGVTRMYRINLVFISIAIVIVGGFASISVFGVYGLLWLLAFPCYTILWNKRVMNWLDPYERIIPNGSEHDNKISEV